MKWQLILIMVLLMIPIVTSLIECEGVMNPGDIPCMVISTWQIPSCTTTTINIYNSNTTLIDIKTMGDYGLSGRCNATWNHSTIDSYVLNWSSGDSSKIIIEEDNNMLIALVIGVSLIVSLFIFLTFAVKEDYPFLANFFFLGIFIFTTVLSFLLWKITSVNSAPYESIMYIIYYVFLVITMLMMLIVLVMLTVEAVKIRKIAGNPIDTYRDNLGKNEQNKF